MPDMDDGFKGKRLVILGLARQGEALARYAAQAGAEVVVSDLRPAAQLQPRMDALKGLNVEFVLGEHPLSLLENADLLAISGGVAADMPLVAAARAQGVTLTNDSQEFMRRTAATVIGITGSAGKSTTTALTGAMAMAATGPESGRRTWVGGNIGRPLIADLAEMGADDLVVQELSSFQLELWELSPPVAAVLNITPNHLDRHGTMAAYSAAKANILRFQDESGVAVLCADDAGAMALAPLVRGRLRTFSIAGAVADGAFVRDEQIWLARGSGEPVRVCGLADVALRGRHNLLNVCAAATLADTVGVDVAAISSAIRTFRGIEHRLELVATIDGVDYINDSIATAPERALAALDSFSEPLILLAGGKDKNMVWDTWARRVLARVKRVILFGALGELLEETLRQNAPGNGTEPPPVRRVETLEEAVAAARAAAVAGDVVLLAPGGTSYDAYPDFVARGEAFRALVGQLQQRQEKAR